MNYTMGANNAGAGATPPGTGAPLELMVCEDLRHPNGSIAFIPVTATGGGTVPRNLLRVRLAGQHASGGAGTPGWDCG